MKEWRKQVPKKKRLRKKKRKKKIAYSLGTLARAIQLKQKPFQQSPTFVGGS